MIQARRDSESGYALVAAVASIAVFGLVATTTIETAHGIATAGGAEISRAHAIAAADAGTAMALQALLSHDAATRWPIDGRTVRRRFDQADLAIRVEDERGKIALNTLEDEDARRLFENLGVEGDRLDVVTDSFLDWTDDDDDARDHGAETAYYLPLGIRPSNTALTSIGETIHIRGFDAALVARLQRVATISYGSGGGFDPRHASPLAVRVMAGETKGAIDEIGQEREAAGQTVALSIDDESLIGRPLTIVTEARLADGARAVRRIVVELTGSSRTPYFIRSGE